MGEKYGEDKEHKKAIKNATTHSAWVAVMVQELGAWDAITIADIHESGQEHTDDSKIDQQNNIKGLKIGLETRTRAEAAEATEEAFVNGDLTVYKEDVGNVVDTSNN